MEKQDSWKRTQDMEIDLKDVLYRICLQWKQIAAVALCAMIFFTGYSYLGRNAGMNPAESETNEPELTKEEEWEVASAVKLQNEIDELEKYLNNSIIMQIDPYNKTKIVMLYSIDSGSGQKLQRITESYLNFIVNGGAAGELKETDSSSWGMDKKYLSELITAYQKTYSLPYQAVVENTAQNMPSETMICVEITGKDEQQAWELAADMQSVLKRHYAEIENMAGRHKLTLASIEKGVQSDSVLQTQQHEKRTLLSANRQNLKAMTDSFNKTQRKEYQEISGMESSLEEAEKEPCGISVKSVLLVLLGSVFAYCCLFVCIYLFQDTVKSAEEIKRLYAFPFYGSMHLNEKRGWLESRSPAACQNKAEQEMIQVLGRIKLACRKRGIAKICMIFDDSFTGREKECVEEMTRKLGQCGIAMTAVENINRNTALWDSMTQIGSVFIVFRFGTTTHQSIDEEMRFCQENDIKVAGAAAWIS